LRRGGRGGGGKASWRRRRSFLEEDYRIASIYFALCDDVIFMQVNQASLELLQLDD
jgi:hypothetical protein